MGHFSAKYLAIGHAVLKQLKAFSKLRSGCAEKKTKKKRTWWSNSFQHLPYEKLPLWVLHSQKRWEDQCIWFCYIVTSWECEETVTDVQTSLVPRLWDGLARKPAEACKIPSPEGMESTAEDHRSLFNTPLRCFLVPQGPWSVMWPQHSIGPFHRESAPDILAFLTNL